MSETLSFVHPDELREHPRNPRTITAERFEALMFALERSPRMMLARPTIALPSGDVLGGNMRLRAAKAMHGDDERYPRFNAALREWGGLPAFIEDLEPAEQREWMLRDNNGYGEYVDQDLAGLITEYERDMDGDLQALGFDQQELDRLLDRDTKDMGAGIGDGDDGPPPDIFGVIVECENEGQQTDLLERLSDEGFNVRALL